MVKQNILIWTLYRKTICFIKTLRTSAIRFSKRYNPFLYILIEIDSSICMNFSYLIFRHFKMNRTFIYCSIRSYHKSIPLCSIACIQFTLQFFKMSRTPKCYIIFLYLLEHIWLNRRK